MEIGIFIPNGSQFDNDIPPPHQRKGSVFWSSLTPLLGLPPEHLPWHNEGVSRIGAAPHGVRPLCLLALGWVVWS